MSASFSKYLCKNENDWSGRTTHEGRHWICVNCQAKWSNAYYFSLLLLYTFSCAFVCVRSLMWMPKMVRRYCERHVLCVIWVTVLWTWNNTKENCEIISIPIVLFPWLTIRAVKIPKLKNLNLHYFLRQHPIQDRSNDPNMMSDCLLRHTSVASFPSTENLKQKN